LKICATLLISACLSAFAETNETESALAATPFRGEASCSSSGCHGGAGEKHDQCVRWSKFDVHTRSYATLTLARSARIAEVLHIGDPAQSGRCTVCHAPFQTVATNDTLRKVLDPASGVSCETCHGAVQNWLLSHTRTDFTHQDRVNAGMRDLKNLLVRANTCVACHQNVDADILKAGHPELIFELDGQCVAEPKHWREATNWSGTATWRVGQVVALREMQWQMSREKSPTEDESNKWSALAWVVTPMGIHASAMPPELEKEDWYDITTSRGIHWFLNYYAERANQFRDQSLSRGLLARRAERLALALDRLVVGLNDDASAKRLDAPLNKLFKDAQSLPDFDPKVFADDLEAFQKALSITP
jgi:Cytochrome c554 and c-prime